VILDTPPVLAVSEVLELGAEIDGLILVACQGKTPRAALAEAVNRLRRVEADPLGVIVNGVEMRGGDSTYGGNYYYSYNAYEYGAEE